MEWLPHPFSKFFNDYMINYIYAGLNNIMAS